MLDFMKPSLIKLSLALVLTTGLFFSPAIALDRDNHDSLRQKSADRSEELLEDGTTAHVRVPEDRNFWGVGFHMGYIGVSYLLLYGEAVLWNERSHFRFGGCLDIGTMNYFTGNYFMSNLMFEAYYLSSSPAAFYIGGGVGMTLLYMETMLTPIPTLRTGLGLELLRGTNFRIDIGPTLDIGFAPSSKVLESFIPIIGGHVRFLL
jgi:hypothetical protein